MKHPRLIAGFWFSFLLMAAVAVAAVAGLGRQESKRPTPRPPAVVMEVLDPSLESYASLWREEIARRFPDAVGVICHGGDLEEGRWVVRSGGQYIQTADALVQHFQAKWPGRVIVLLACNPGHLALHESGVYYALDSVWCVPDRDTAEPDSAPGEDRLTMDGDAVLGGADRWHAESGVVGNIFEFVDAD